jgi:hypothetical protein
VSFLIAITPFRQNLKAQDSLRKYRANLIVFLEISLKSVPLVRKPPDPGATTNSLLPRCTSIGLQPGGRHFSAGVRKPPDQGATTTPLLPDAPASVFKPRGRNFSAGVRKPPVEANWLLLGSRQIRIDRDAHRFLADDVSIDPNKDPMITLAHR